VIYMYALITVSDYLVIVLITYNYFDYPLAYTIEAT
jgi:hypothetical protein